MGLALGILVGLGAALAWNGQPLGWPSAALALLAICLAFMYAAELRWSDRAVHLWDGDGGPVFAWLRVWIPLGRIVAPAFWIGYLLHLLLFRVPLLDRWLLATVGTLLLSTMIWRWRQAEVGVGLLAAAGLAWSIMALGGSMAVPAWVLALGLGILALTHPRANPRFLAEAGWGAYQAWALAVGGGLAVGLAARATMGWGSFSTSVGVVALLAGALLLKRRRMRPPARAAAAGLAWLLALIPASGFVAAGALVWLLGEAGAAWMLWLWLRRYRPGMPRPHGRAVWALSVGLLAGWIGTLGLALGILPWHWAAGWAVWFTIPPVIDAYRTGRFPFRRPVYPETHSWADL